MKALLLTAFGIGLLMVGTLAFAEPTTTQPVVAPDLELIQLKFPDNVEIKILVQYVSQRMGVNILYDDAIGSKRVTVNAPTQIPKASLIGLLESVLKMADLAMIDADQPGWKKIVPAKDLLAITSGVQRDQELLNTASAGMIVTQVFPIAYANLPEIEKNIQPLLTKPGGNSFGIPNANLLIVTDYSGVLRRVAGMIELLDAAQGAAQLHFVDIQHMDASELVREVTSLLQEKEGSSSQRSQGKPPVRLTALSRTNQIVIIAESGKEKEALQLIQKLDTPSTLETKSYQFDYVAPKRIETLLGELFNASPLRGRYQTAIDIESGTFIVTAPLAIHHRIEQLKKEFDTPPQRIQDSHIRFYKLKNTTADQVLATIQALDSGKGSSLTEIASQSATPSETKGLSSGPNAPPSAPGEMAPPPPFFDSGEEKESSSSSESPAKALQRVSTKDAIITVDTNTNTLIVVAPPAVQRVYENLIEQLDKRRPQVLIEVTLVTLDDSADRSLGIEMAYKGSIAGREFLTFSSFGLADVDPLTGSMTLKPGIGFNGALLGPGSFNAVIRAIESTGHSKVVAAPRVLVNDNASATLTSVQEAPFTSINASQTVATTSFAGYASAGTTLTVTPHISEGDHLQLEYSITLNSFTGESSDNAPPPRQTNTLNSNVTVPDGYAVVVGGLKRRDLSDTATKVPLLGDIPYLGSLFSMNTKTNKESTLYIFIRPIILRDDQFEDLKYLSRRDLKLAGVAPHFPQSDPILIE